MKPRKIAVRKKPKSPKKLSRMQKAKKKLAEYNRLTKKLPLLGNKMAEFVRGKPALLRDWNTKDKAKVREIDAEISKTETEINNLKKQLFGDKGIEPKKK